MGALLGGFGFFFMIPSILPPKLVEERFPMMRL
jgi:hypothetical protein